jgi:DNA integrity scanning protein DisA with diadenylate cyclase activity
MARINSHNTVFSTEVGVKSAETNYETLQKNKIFKLVWQIMLFMKQIFLSRCFDLDLIIFLLKAPIAGVI